MTMFIRSLGVFRYHTVAVTNWDTKTCFESSTHESIRDEALFQPFIALSVPALLRMFINLNHF